MVAPIIPIGAAVSKLVVKHGLPAVQKALKAQSTRKTQQVRVNEARTKLLSPKASRKIDTKEARASNKDGKLRIKSDPKSERGKTKDWETRSGKMVNNPKHGATDQAMVVMKNGYPTVKGGSSSVSGRKLSVPSKPKRKGK